MYIPFVLVMMRTWNGAHSLNTNNTKAADYTHELSNAKAFRSVAVAALYQDIAFLETLETLKVSCVSSRKTHEKSPY